jgi:Cof subfamily protein (haloacid dehalogenase superfamily)/HAD superfamily hydrolase (TIGR01509 family)
MMIKVLIADVDGTLVTRDKTLTPQTCDAVERLRAAGITFTITSGRPPRGMAKLIAPLKLTAPIAAFNGGMYVKPDLTTVLAQRTINPTAAKQAVDHLLQAGLDVWVYRGTEWYIRTPGAFRVDRERRTVGFEPVVTQDLYAVLDAAIKIVGISQDLALVERCEAELSASLGMDASAARSQPYYLDITHPEANKGMVVREAARLLKIPVEQVATIGDMANDLPMLRVAGLSVAMGNADADIQRVARHVTSSNEQEGFARAVDSFILGAPPIGRTNLGLPPRVRACLFGLGGVLTLSADVQAKAWKRVFDAYLQERARATGESFVPFDVGDNASARDNVARFDGQAPLEVVGSFLSSRGIELPVKILQALIARKNEVLTDLLRQESVETYEGAIRYLRAARAAGLRTAVVSPSSHCPGILLSAGIADLIDAQIDRAVAAAKHLADRPAPDMYLAAAESVGVDPDQAVLFEDDLAGVEAGRAGHIGYIVGVDRLGREADLRRRGADIVVKDPADLLEPAR